VNKGDKVNGILVYALVPRGKVEFDKVSAYAKEMLEKKLKAGFITIHRVKRKYKQINIKIDKNELCRMFMIFYEDVMPDVCEDIKNLISVMYGASEVSYCNRVNMEIYKWLTERCISLPLTRRSYWYVKYHPHISRNYNVTLYWDGVVYNCVYVKVNNVNKLLHESDIGKYWITVLLITQLDD